MRVSVLQENLVRALSIVSRAVSSRPSNPITANILLATEDSRLKVCAINLEQGISITDRIGADIESEGAITIPARELLETVSVLEAGHVELEVDEDTSTLQLSTKSAVSKIKGIPAEQFPAVPEPDAETGIRLPADVFQSMIDQVVFAAAKEDNRPILMGILTQFEGNRVSMVAADGFRLARRVAELTDAIDQTLSVVIPARTLQEISRLSPDADNLVLVSVSNTHGQVMFNIGAVDVVSQLIEGKFPDVEKLIPKSATTITVVDKKELIQGCKIVEIMARNMNNTARIAIRPSSGGGEGELSLYSQGAERGDSKKNLPAEISGPGLEISFNVRYLLDVLSVLPDGQVALETNSPAQPGIVRPAGDQNFTYVIMPMSTR